MLFKTSSLSGAIFAVPSGNRRSVLLTARPVRRHCRPAGGLSATPRGSNDNDADNMWRQRHLPISPQTRRLRAHGNSERELHGADLPASGSDVNKFPGTYPETYVPNVGDEVQVSAADSEVHGQEGRVVRVDKQAPGFPVVVEMNNTCYFFALGEVQPLHDQQLPNPKESDATEGLALERNGWGGLFDSSSSDEDKGKDRNACGPEGPENIYNPADPVTARDPTDLYGPAQLAVNEEDNQSQLNVGDKVVVTRSDLARRGQEATVDSIDRGAFMGSVEVVFPDKSRCSFEAHELRAVANDRDDASDDEGTRDEGGNPGRQGSGGSDCDDAGSASGTRNEGENPGLQGNGNAEGGDAGGARNVGGSDERQSDSKGRLGGGAGIDPGIVMMPPNMDPGIVVQPPDVDPGIVMMPQAIDSGIAWQPPGSGAALAAEESLAKGGKSNGTDSNGEGGEEVGNEAQGEQGSNAASSDEGSGSDAPEGQVGGNGNADPGPDQDPDQKAQQQRHAADLLRREHHLHRQLSRARSRMGAVAYGRIMLQFAWLILTHDVAPRVEGSIDRVISSASRGRVRLGKKGSLPAIFLASVVVSAFNGLALAYGLVRDALLPEQPRGVYDAVLLAAITTALLVLTLK